MKKSSTAHNSGCVINNYMIKQTIGKGTFGKVKLGIHIPTNEKVAIKILEKNKMVEKDDFERVAREMSIIQLLNHPNVIKILDIFENDDNFYIVMEYCEGGELFNYIVKKRRLSDDEASYFYYQIINGLEYIHSLGVVHRDLKPENLLLTKDNTIKIIDFGLSNYFSKKLLITPCGSPCYASPEMVSGQHYNGFRIDVWSTGIILYAMLCGYLPFEDKNNEVLFKTILECNVDYPRCLSGPSRDLMRKIMVTNPEKRITIPDIKQHKFYLKGQQIYNNKFSSVTVRKPASGSFISNNNTSRTLTQRHTKEESPYIPLKTENENPKRFTLNTFWSETVEKSKKEKENNNKERRHETDIFSETRKPYTSKGIKSKVSGSGLNKYSNKVKHVNLSSLMTLNSMRITNHSPFKVTTIVNKPPSVASTSKKKTNTKTITNTSSHNINNITSNANPNSILINNAVINLNMIEPRFILPSGKVKQKRTKSSSVARQNQKSDKRHLTLLSHLLQSKNDKIMSAHQKYITNVCHTETASKSKENSRTQNVNESNQTNNINITNNKTITNNNYNKKILSSFFENYKPIYLNTEVKTTSANSNLKRFQTMKSNSISKQKKNKIKTDYFFNEHFNSKNKDLAQAIKYIRDKVKSLYKKDYISKNNVQKI